MNRSRHVSFLQANLNHCAGAQDLLLQSMAEWDVDVAVACEPYYVPPHPNWIGDLEGNVAVLVRTATGPPLSMVERGSGYVVAERGEYVIIGAYFSPNRSLAEFEVFLDSIRAAVGRLASRPIVFLGDLNAKSRAWGNPATDVRGRAVQVWALLTGLSLLNRGTTHTCVRQQGGSIVDVSFATPAIARRVSNWRVMEGTETLSDHLYICFEVSSLPPTTVTNSSGTRSHFPRWTISRLNRDLAEEAAIVQRWASRGAAQSDDADELARRMRTALSAVCAAAMPRTRRRANRRQVYWWTPEIRSLRTVCSRTRRAYVRCRRRNGHDPDLENRLRAAYRQAKRELQLAISRAKKDAWSEILDGLNRDPWGRPYRAARKKLGSQGAPLTETLQPAFLDRVVEELFPDHQGHVPPTMAPLSAAGETESADIPLVTESEMGTALLRLRGRRTAPGPDGVPGRILLIASEYLEDQLRKLFDRCIRTGRFPKIWKEGRLCLLQKPGRPLEEPSAYRPVVLLDEAAKAFEKILADRLVKHLDEVGPGLSDAQYGFRAGRSTIDALAALKSLTTAATARGEVVLAVSLDVKNAFNTLPFETLREALRYHGVPLYLGRVLDSYLGDREIVWESGDGEICRRHISCGVPQGSVLGPTLWNVGFDWILRGSLPPGSGVICYADDTLVTVRAGSYEEAVRLGAVTANIVVSRIELLGLRVSLSKTEALLFHGPRRGPPRVVRLAVHIQGVEVTVKAQMKYLGLMLDGRWNFGAHFTQLAPKVINAAAALGRLLPNVGGPDSTCRRLYMGVIRSMALYGAPIWVDALNAGNRTLLRRPQRVIDIRAIRGYRTVSWTVATLLAGDPPWPLQAEVLADVYRHRAEVRARGERLSVEEVQRVRAASHDALIRKWADELEAPVAGETTVAAIRPHLVRWLSRRHGTLTFRVVQVLTGHGCFGKYLHRIAGREATPACHECDAPVDTARHTLEECAAWAPQRHTLAAVLGSDLSLPNVVTGMLRSKTCWEATASFCESVIALKEAAERDREEDAHADAIRRRRPGRRRRRYAHLQPPP